MNLWNSCGVCLSVCVFTFEVPFNGLFAPTSRSRMSNIFRDSEFLGKSNGKKWSQIGTFLFGSGLKSPRKKKFFCCCWFCLTKHGGNHASRWIRDLWSKGISLIFKRSVGDAAFAFAAGAFCRVCCVCYALPCEAWAALLHTSGALQAHRCHAIIWWVLWSLQCRPEMRELELLQ